MNNLLPPRAIVFNFFNFLNFLNYITTIVVEVVEVVKVVKPNVWAIVSSGTRYWLNYSAR